MIGLYIHIPFCHKICTYCDFYKMVASDSFQTNFTNYLIKDLDYELSKVNYNLKLNTIYIGGGTPSSLSLNNLERIFCSLSKYINLNKIEEFTIELNPEDINRELLTLLKKYHVNRLSIGVQTLLEAHQKFLGRIFTFQTLKTKIEMIKEMGFDNFNLDLIYALPHQTLAELDEDLFLLLSLKPNHLSCYSLILEDHTIIKHQYEKKQWELIDEDLESTMYYHIIDTLEKAGYNQYETSNFAKSSYQSKHNLIYWNNDNYFAIGPSGSSFIGDTRYKRTTDLKTYYEALDNKDYQKLYEEINILTKEEHMEEEVMLALRLTTGIDKKNFYEKYLVNISDIFPNVSSLIKAGLLVESNNHLFIPLNYRYIANFVIRKLIIK